MKNSRTAKIGLILAAMIWGIGFVGNDYILSIGFSPLQVNFIRLSIGALILGIISFNKLKMIKKQSLINGCYLGLILFISFTFQTYGLKYTSVTNNAFITTTNVVWVAIISFVFLKKKLDLLNIIAIILTFIGMILLVVDKGFSQIRIGDFYTLICAIGFALHIIFIDQLHDEDPIVLTFLQFFSASILSLLLIIITQQTNIPQLSDGLTKPILSLLFLGIFPTSIAFLIQVAAQRYTNSTTASLILATEAVFGTIFGVLLINEMINLKQFIGMVLIFTAILLVEIDFSIFNGKNNG